MSGLSHIAGEEIVRHDRAANGGNANGAAFDSQFIDRFGDKPIHDAMNATGTIIRNNGQQRMGTLENDLLFSHTMHLLSR